MLHLTHPIKPSKKYYSWFKKLTPKIVEILQKPQKTQKRHDLILGYIESDKQHYIDMKMGDIWDFIFKNVPGFEPSKFGNDFISHNKKLIIESKNRTNTLNSSSKSGTVYKLKKELESYPGYKCIIGCINDNEKSKTIRGRNYYDKNHDVYIYTGFEYLKLFFDTDSDVNFIVYSLKKIVKTHLDNL